MTIVRTSINAEQIATGGPRRDWNQRSETIPEKPPMMPKRRARGPSLSKKNSAPFCGCSLAKTKYALHDAVAEDARGQADDPR